MSGLNRFLGLCDDNYDEIEGELINEMTAPLYRHFSQEQIDIYTKVLQKNVTFENVQDFYHATYGE